MGKRNRERRAAKARQRRASQDRVNQDRVNQDRACGGGGAWRFDVPPPQPPPGREMLETALLLAARRWAAGDESAARACAEELAGPRFTGRPRLVDAAAALVLDGALGEAWRGGWLPSDLYQLARRRLPAAAVGYLVDAIAAESRRYAPAALHERWREQLRQIDAVVWWQPGEQHLDQWARRHGRSRADGLTAVVEILGLLATVPVVARVLPLPGSGPARPAAGGSGVAGVDEKVLARVRALLAKAESTEFAEEAEALSAKAQELMSRHALARAVVEADDGRRQVTSVRRLWLDAPYLGAKALLVDAVAGANRCRSVFHEKLGFVTVVGHDVDLQIVELLTTSLLVQATRALVAAGRQRAHGAQSRIRSYRQSFLIAYACRIGERLGAANEVARAAAADAQCLLPVLAARQRAVDDAMAEMYPELVQRSYSVTNGAGWQAGRAAADLALFDVGQAVGPPDRGESDDLAAASG